MIVTVTLVSLLFSVLRSSFIVRVNDVRGSPRGTPKLFIRIYTIDCTHGSVSAIVSHITRPFPSVYSIHVQFHNLDLKIPTVVVNKKLTFSSIVRLL